tara:strand:+ start:264 stop:593 length:330 start_codon:yes stop_codon:yes gene_type:complete
MTIKESIDRFLDYNTEMTSDDRCEIAEALEAMQSSKKSWLSGAMTNLSSIDNLNHHISQYHNGNTSSFARSQHVSESQARRWIKRNCMVVDGVVYCEVSKASKTKADKE